MSTINCRKFNKRIRIQERVIKKDEYGVVNEYWITRTVIKADIWNIHGSELLSNVDQFTNKTYKRCQIRYKKYLDSVESIDPTHNYRIVYRNSIWDITSIDDIKDEHKIMELLLVKNENETYTVDDDIYEI